MRRMASAAVSVILIRDRVVLRLIQLQLACHVQLFAIDFSPVVI